MDQKLTEGVHRAVFEHPRRQRRAVTVRDRPQDSARIGAAVPNRDEPSQCPLEDHLELTTKCQQLWVPLEINLDIHAAIVDLIATRQRELEVVVVNDPGRTAIGQESGLVDQERAVDEG